MPSGDEGASAPSRGFCSIHYPTRFSTGTTRIGLSFRWSFTEHAALASCAGCFAKEGLIHNSACSDWPGARMGSCQNPRKQLFFSYGDDVKYFSVSRSGCMG